MPYSSPAAAVTGGLAPASWGNAVKAGLDYLANPPTCRVYNSANQSITNNTLTILAFNSERHDTDTMHDTVTNNSRITFNTAGVYVVTANLLWTAGADYTALFAELLVNGATSIGQAFLGTVADAGFSPPLNLSTIYKFSVADYVQVRVAQKNTAVAARNVGASANNSPEFSACWLALG